MIEKIGVDDLLIHPRYAVPKHLFGVVDLWLASVHFPGDGGFPRLAHLPDPGGMGDQSAWLIDAFQICAAAFVALNRKP
ncbi:MAG: hypothetical protein MI806_07340 [Minwuiales bacterium]|nr:hypothetical protein [Minwuiales bacterium]